MGGLKRSVGFTALLLVGEAQGSTALSASALSASFKSWSTKFGKAVFSSLEHRAVSLAAFAENAALAASLTAASSSKAVYSAAASPFSDRSAASFSAERLLPPLRLEPDQLAEGCLRNGAVANAAPALSLAAPESFNWSDYGAVTPVRDQGQCGSCWAFSTAGAIEGAWALAGNPLTVLSPQDIVDCSHGCSAEGVYGDVCNSGCTGGWPWSAFSDLEKEGGVASEADYPYLATAGASCRLGGAAATISGYSCLASDEDAMLRWLLHHGPLSVALDARHLFLYSSGVHAPEQCSSTMLDHAVLIVGYGTDPVGGPYWLVKNSWGERWGEAGYFRIARGSNMCGIANAASAALIFEDDTPPASRAPAFARFVGHAAA